MFPQTSGAKTERLSRAVLISHTGNDAGRPCISDTPQHVRGQFHPDMVAMIVEDQRVAHDGLGEAVGQCMGVFYANNFMFGSRYPEWLQHYMNVLVSLFQRYGIASNVAKFRTMMCQPGAIRSGVSAEAKALKFTGVGDSYQVRLLLRIPFLGCGVELTAGSKTAQRCLMHGTEPEI